MLDVPYIGDTQSVVPGLVASAALGNWLEIKHQQKKKKKYNANFHAPYQSTEPETGSGVWILNFNRPFG